jgi:glycosyltransferase involved in cell wall biosynthesis
MANRMVATGHDVHLVTTTRPVVRDRYAREICVHTPAATRYARLSLELFRLRSVAKLVDTVCGLAPDIVHVTGPHAWTILLVRALKTQGIPVVHTLHALDSRRGGVERLLLALWNAIIVRSVDRILVHSQVLEQQLLAKGIPSERVTCTPLLSLFVGETRLQATSDPTMAVEYKPWALYLGRLDQHRELEHLITACAMMDQESTSCPRVILAGPGDLSTVWSGPTPDRLEIHNRWLDDMEALDLLRRCGLVILPHEDPAQMVLVATAYWFRKPIVVTRTGALPEYVREGQTGCVVEPKHPPALARCLEQLLDDSDRLAQMGAAGRAWYDARRETEELALLQVYGDLARMRSARGPVAQSSDAAI